MSDNEYAAGCAFVLIFLLLGALFMVAHTGLVQ